MQKKRNENGKAQQTQLAKKLSVLVGILIVPYFPYFTAVLLRSAYPQLVSEDIVRRLSWRRYFNSCLNPLLYFYAVPVYRKSMKKNLQKLKRSLLSI